MPDPVEIHFPQRARDALRAVLGHEPSDRLVDATATVLAALQGEQQATGDGYREALELAAGTAMPSDPRDVAAIVDQNEPLPRPSDDQSPEGILRHVFVLAADQHVRRGG